MKSGIYIITNKANGKQYIGQSINIPKRWSEHARTPAGERSYFYNAIRKYGWENFDKRILISVGGKDDMNRYERLLIERFNTLSPNGYNCKDGGLSGLVCEATRKKQSEAKKGKPKNLTPEQRATKSAVARGRRHSEETKQKMREWNLGRKMPEHSKSLTEEYRQRMRELKTGQSNGRLGVRHTDEARAKMSAAHKGKPKSPEHLAAIAAAKLRKKQERELKLEMEDNSDA